MMVLKMNRLELCFLHLTQMHPILVSLTPIWSAALRFRRSHFSRSLITARHRVKHSPGCYRRQKAATSMAATKFAEMCIYFLFFLLLLISLIFSLVMMMISEDIYAFWSVEWIWFGKVWNQTDKTSSNYRWLIQKFSSLNPHLLLLLIFNIPTICYILTPANS